MFCISTPSPSPQVSQTFFCFFITTKYCMCHARHYLSEREKSENLPAPIVLCASLSTWRKLLLVQQRPPQLLLRRIIQNSFLFTCLRCIASCCCLCRREFPSVVTEFRRYYKLPLLPLTTRLYAFLLRPNTWRLRTSVVLSIVFLLLNRLLLFSNNFYCVCWSVFSFPLLFSAVFSLCVICRNLRASRLTPCLPRLPHMRFSTPKLNKPERGTNVLLA